MRFDPRLAPVKVAVLPLSRNADLSPKARDLAAAAARQLERRLRRRRRDRPPLPPPGRDRHAVLRHRRLRHARGPGRHRPRARHDDPGAGRARRRARLAGRSDCSAADRHRPAGRSRSSRPPNSWPLSRRPTWTGRGPSSSRCSAWTIDEVTPYACVARSGTTTLRITLAEELDAAAVHGARLDRRGHPR